MIDSTNTRVISSSQPDTKARVRSYIEELLKPTGDAGTDALNRQVAQTVDEKNKLGYFKALAEGVPISTEMWLDKFITVHPLMIALKEQVKKLAKVNDPVLVYGESGTGKELISHALHGNRAKEKFIEINCAGLPEHLIESELFGHSKGAFTGADSAKKGLIEEADGGTLFLDEIGELPQLLQPKLLRVLQDGRIRRVGSNTYNEVSFRLVAATHRNLMELVEQKKFRHDLFNRISTFELQTIAIRYRAADVPLIVDSLDPEHKLPKDINWMRYLIEDNTQGNVRTIQRLVRRYLVLGSI